MESEWFAATEAGLGWATAQDFEEAILTNFFIYKLTGPFILISLLKLKKLTGFPNRLNTKGSNFLTAAA